MKQILFETRQKANDLLQEALSIWRQSDHADALDGIEKDPVFSLLMMALAYQSNETDSELERLKTEVLSDFARLLVPYEMGHAIPATAVVQAVLQDDVPEMTLDEGVRFLLDSQHPFIPLLQTRALNGSVRSVVRLDGRRWKVTLDFKHPVTDLSGFAFALTNVNYRTLKVTLKGQRLPLIRPSMYGELPFTPSFSPDSMTYNLGQFCNLSMLPMDLFARQNLRCYTFDTIDSENLLPGATEQLELVFEFSGVPDNVSFDKSCLFLNPVLLVNAEVHELTLSSDRPVVRLSGSQPGQTEKDLTGRQFLHLVRPPETQIYGNMELEVRGVAGDRFNQGTLLKLVNCIITRYHSDFYAFQQMQESLADDALFQLESALARLKTESARNALNSVSGVYLMPRNWSLSQKKSFSLNVRYVTTAGAAVNPMLNTSTVFSAPSGLVSGECRCISAPVPGVDELRDEGSVETMMRYYMATGDRLVTMADIKAFCRKELIVRYGIGGDVIRNIRVQWRQRQDGAGCGYEIPVEITLAANSYIRRSFADRLTAAEILMRKMIEVRSANIYPVRVTITIEEES